MRSFVWNFGCLANGRPCVNVNAFVGIRPGHQGSSLGKPFAPNAFVSTSLGRGAPGSGFAQALSSFFGSFHMKSSSQNLNFDDVVPRLGIPKWKRVLDITCIVLALPFLVPIIFLIGLVIKVVSPGPVIFKQERVGYRGRRFTCLKFRTMRVNAETSSHQTHLYHLMTSNSPMSKLDSAGDPRLIRFGSLLRASGLDELPQLFNVLCGDMSLVGPRPCMEYEFEKYLPHQRRRFNTLPGLTGLWQVSGKNRTTFSQMIDLDIHYAIHKSLWLDLKIILKTVPAIIIQCLEKLERPKARTRDSLGRQSALRSCNSSKSICETVGTH